EGRSWHSRFRSPRFRSRSALVRFAWSAAVAVPAIFAAYLVAANIILSASVLPAWVSATENLSMSYASAYSVIPGRVHVSQLVVRGSDSNIQFELEVREAEVD